MTDLEMTEKVAEKCGLDVIGISSSSYVYVNEGADTKRFDPLNDMNDLMNIVIPKLLETYGIEMYENTHGKRFSIHGKRFNIYRYGKPEFIEGIYPANFPRAVCNALCELG